MYLTSAFLGSPECLLKMMLSKESLLMFALKIPRLMLKQAL